MKVSFEYGHGLMTAELPDSTDIFIPGETVPDPPYIPEDQIEAKTLESGQCDKPAVHYRNGSQHLCIIHL